VENSPKYGKKEDIALDMWVKLARASATFGKISGQNIKSFGLTVPQFGVLECLGHLGPLSLTSLSRKMLVSNGNITCVIDRLARAGVVERIPSRTDKRSTYVKLTPHGKKMFRDNFARHAQFIGTAAAVLTEEEQTTLSRLLKKLGLTLKENTTRSNGSGNQTRGNVP